MTGYEIFVDELEKAAEQNAERVQKAGILFVKLKQLEETYAMPSAFDKFVEHTRFS